MKRIAHVTFLALFLLGSTTTFAAARTRRAAATCTGSTPCRACKSRVERHFGRLKREPPRSLSGEDAAAALTFAWFYIPRRSGLNTFFTEVIC